MRWRSAREEAAAGQEQGRQAARSRRMCLATGACKEELPEMGKNQHGHRRETASDIVLTDVVVIVSTVVTSRGCVCKENPLRFLLETHYPT